jgi:hypothetical protein
VEEQKGPMEDVQTPLSNPRVEASPKAGGPECPTCGDRFPSQQSLDEHVAQEHKLTS